MVLSSVASPWGGEPNGFRFVDTATQAGIHAQIVCGGPEKKWIPEANGSGVAWLDYDNDRWMDLLIVNGSTMEQLRKIVSGGSSVFSGNGVYLYRNLSNGRFEDVTVKSGLSNPYWGTGANAADYNRDGYTDILITTIGLDLLFRNNGDGTFTEVGKAAGLSRKLAWHTGSAFGDYDSDGNLDLYAAGYVDIQTLFLTNPAPTCQYKGLQVFCGPMGLKGERDILYHNNGDGTFSEVTQHARVEDKSAFHGLAAVFEDFNGDGKVDLFVANDSDPNYLYLNLGNGTFKESAVLSGVAFNVDGTVQANMGVAVGDYDNDGRMDLLTTTFEDAHFPFFAQDASGFFEDISGRVGLGTTTEPYLGWGAGFADVDNDGQKDLWLANGHIYPRIDQVSGKYNQPLLVFGNQAGRFGRSYSFPAVPNNSYRGAAAGDYNNDGKVDIAAIPITGSPVLLTNLTEKDHSWIGFALKGRRSNGEAIGTRMRIEACGNVQYESVRNGGSYISRDDSRPRFGLGNCTKVGRAVITWPRGKVQVLNDLAVNRYIFVDEPH
jgi:enediyne biosynthesis protein E4